MTLNKSNFVFNPKPNSSISLLPFPYVGFVKNNVDTQCMGRLGVWIPELCGDPLDQSSWILCSYCSPFAGATDISELENYQDKGSKTVSQQSYGWVSVPPDINTEVMVIFAGGDISRGYWIGCTYHQNMNHMVPGIAADTTYPGQKDADGTALGNVVPVAEYNKASVTGSPTNVNRPVFQPLATGLDREGLMTDLERGPASTSMRREAPPLMSGWLSPRGNSIHIDDNAQNEFIRLRTRSGAQVLIHETTGYVYINSKDGNSWFEISDAGIDGYTAQSISLRAKSDINLVAGGNIVLDAANIYMRASGEINLAAKTIQIGASGNLTMSAGGSIASAAGGSWSRKATAILDNSGPVASATGPSGKKILDTTSVENGGRAKWTAGGGQYDTIAGRLPTHEPWIGHPNAKVPPIPVTSAPVVGQGVSGSGGPTGTAPNSCSFGVAKTKPIGTIASNAIANASSQTGVSQATLLAFADKESSFNTDLLPTATHHAAGLFQFMPATWTSMLAQHGNALNVASDASSLDPVANSLMGAQYIQDNQQILVNKGLATAGQYNPGDLYLMHFLGGNAGPKFIQQAQSNPDASAASLFPGPASQNKPLFYNADGSAKTMSQVYGEQTNEMNSKAQAYASQTGLPAPCQRDGGAGGSSTGGSAGGQTGVSNKIDQSSPEAAIASAQKLVGRPHGRNGECVALLQSDVLNLPTTSQWRPGQNNLSANPPTPGTGIATFGVGGHYTNKGIKVAAAKSEQAHAAIYLGPTARGFKVLEQYNGTPAHITEYIDGDPRGGEKDARNYHVIKYGA